MQSFVLGFSHFTGRFSSANYLGTSRSYSNLVVDATNNLETYQEVFTDLQTAASFLYTPLDMLRLFPNRAPYTRFTCIPIYKTYAISNNVSNCSSDREKKAGIILASKHDGPF